VDLGSTFTVLMTVSNGGSTVIDVSPSSLSPLPSTSAIQLSGPAPASVTLNAGALQVFTYTYSASAMGSVAFSGSADGMAIPLTVGSAANTGPVASNAVNIYSVGYCNPTDTATPTETSSPSPGAADTATPTPFFSATATPSSTATPTPSIIPVELLTQNIPAGSPATVTLSNGAQVIVPSGCFSPPVTLTVQRYTNNPAAGPSSFSILGATYQIDAGGIPLLLPVTLVFPYDPLDIPAGQTEADLTVAYFDGVSWTQLTGTVDTVAHTISVSTTHFSLWAVAVKKLPGRPAPPSGVNGFFVHGAVQRGQDLCAYPSKPLLHSHWILFNAAGQVVSKLDASGPNACLQTGGLTPGFYYLKAQSEYSDGGQATDFKKLVILP
jgi:hypothetical protein